MEIRDKVALVTGAGSGLGQATALAKCARSASYRSLQPQPKGLAEVKAEVVGGGRPKPANLRGRVTRTWVAGAGKAGLVRS